MRRVEWRVCEVCEVSPGNFSLFEGAGALLALPHNLKQRLAEGGQPTGRGGLQLFEMSSQEKARHIQPPGNRT